MTDCQLVADLCRVPRGIAQRALTVGQRRQLALHFPTRLGGFTLHYGNAARGVTECSARGIGAQPYGQRFPFMGGCRCLGVGWGSLPGKHVRDRTMITGGCRGTTSPVPPGRASEVPERPRSGMPGHGAGDPGNRPERLLLDPQRAISTAGRGVPGPPGRAPFLAARCLRHCLRHGRIRECCPGSAWDAGPGQWLVGFRWPDHRLRGLALPVAEVPGQQGAGLGEVPGQVLVGVRQWGRPYGRTAWVCHAGCRSGDGPPGRWAPAVPSFRSPGTSSGAMRAGSHVYAGPEDLTITGGEKRDEVFRHGTVRRDREGRRRVLTLRALCVRPPSGACARHVPDRREDGLGGMTAASVQRRQCAGAPGTWHAGGHRGSAGSGCLARSLGERARVRSGEDARGPAVRVWVGPAAGVLVSSAGSRCSRIRS